jgi:hypothetical protein
MHGHPDLGHGKLLLGSRVGDDAVVKLAPDGALIGVSSPSERAACSTARLIPASETSRACSCLAMFRISCELSELTSVAVLIYPLLSKSKYSVFHNN